MSQMELPDPVLFPGDHGAALPWPSPDVAAAINAFVDRSPFGVAVVDTDLRFLLVSEGLAALQGQEAAKTVGKRIDEVLPPPFGVLVGQRLRQALDSGVPMVDVETWGTFVDPDAARSFVSSFYRLDSVSGTPLGVVVLITETTELKQAEIAARSAASQLDLLQQVTETLSGRGTVADVTQVALTGAAQAVRASSAMIMVPDERAVSLVPLSWSGQADDSMDRFRQATSLEARLPTSDTLRTATITLLGTPAERDHAYPDLAGGSGDLRAWAFVPLVAQDRVIGVVIFAWAHDRPFSDTEISLLSSVALQCALALEQAHVLEAERDARRATQFLVEVTRFIVEGSEDGIFALSNGNHILTVNRRFLEVMGLPPDSIALGGDANELLAPCLALAADPDAMAAHLASGRENPSETFTLEFEMKDGRILSGTSSPILDRHATVLGRVWYIRDDTERRAQEAEQLLALDELLAGHEHQVFLLQAAEIISQGDSYGDTLERLAQVAVPVLADLCLVDALTMDGRVVRMAARHSDPELQPLVDELASKYAPAPTGVHPSIEVMHTGRARWSETMSDEFLRRTTRDDEHFALLKRLSFTSYMTLPLVADNQILGSITLVSAGSGRRFGHPDLALADEFTSCVAQVVAAARRHESARYAAHTLQASLLPDHLPDVPGLDLAVRYLPATVDNDVGGDFYDVIADPGRITTVLIGDVAGHDMTAAAIMGKIRTAARVLASQASGPRHFIEMLRQGWDSLELPRMATLLVASIDPATGELRIASAGHPPPLLVEAGEARFLKVKPTTPLGAPRSEVHEWRGTLATGSTLFLFTDGLVEDRQRRFQEGTEELLRAAAGYGSPDALCDRVLQALVPDEGHHGDDIAMVGLARIG